MKFTYKLTSKGFENYEDVLRYTFVFINMLKKKGVSKEIFEEIKFKHKMDFEF